MSRARASRVQEGSTPLFMAAGGFESMLRLVGGGRRANYPAVVRALLNAGADKTITANNGQKPIDRVYGRSTQPHNEPQYDAIVALLR